MTAVQCASSEYPTQYITTYFSGTRHKKSLLTTYFENSSIHQLSKGIYEINTEANARSRTDKLTEMHERK